MIVKIAFYLKCIYMYQCVKCNWLWHTVIWLPMASSVMYIQYFKGYLDWKENLWNWFYIHLKIKSIDFRAYLFITPCFSCIFELRQTSPYLSVLLWFYSGIEWELLKWFLPKYRYWKLLVADYRKQNLTTVDRLYFFL